MSGFDLQRQRMVEDQLIRRGIRDPRILKAFSTVPRHLFVPEEVRDKSYADRPLPIGGGQTISQPYIQALMMQELDLKPEAKVFEIGTGSGYETALLCELVSSVFSIERIQELADAASKVLAGLGYADVHLRCADGTLGWPEEAPFDGILAAAAASEIPQAFLEQLCEGGRLVIPIGSSVEQTLTVIRRSDGAFEKKDLCSCLFVPLIGA